MLKIQDKCWKDGISMSEKRFVYGVIKGSRQAHIKDCHNCKSATIDVYDDNIKYFVDKLNEQQAIIEHLTIEKHQADKRLQTIIAELKKENEQLKTKCDALQKKTEMDKNDFFISEAKRMTLLAFIRDKALQKEYFEWERRIYDE